MSDHKELGGHAVSGAAQLAVSAGPTAYGLLTLNNLALLFGILASIAVLMNTLLNMWWSVQDRRKRATHDA